MNIIMEKKNGKAKEFDYNTGELVFEGEYLYNQKIKGKKYINGKLEYEGDYLFDKKWNGKGYDKNGNIIYELVNGNGTIKQYNQENILIYEGEYLNGIKNGKGKEYQYGKLIYEGEYLNGKRNRKGKEYSNKNINLLYEGEFLNGKRNGKGKECDPFYLGRVIFDGEFLNGERWKGIMKEYHNYNKLKFEVEYIDGKINGKGKRIL